MSSSTEISSLVLLLAEHYPTEIEGACICRCEESFGGFTRSEDWAIHMEEELIEAGYGYASKRNASKIGRKLTKVTLTLPDDLYEAAKKWDFNLSACLRNAIIEQLRLGNRLPEGYK